MIAFSDLQIGIIGRGNNARVEIIANQPVSDQTQETEDECVAGCGKE